MSNVRHQPTANGLRLTANRRTSKPSAGGTSRTCALVLLCSLCTWVAAYPANPAHVFGVDAIGANPAQLAAGERFSYRFLNLQVGAGNNAFDLLQYNRYTGAYLDETAKQQLFGSIPAQGFKLGTNVEADLLDFAIGRVGLAVRNRTAVAATVPRDLFDLALWGNALNRTYSASTLGGDAISYCDATLAYGFPLPAGFQAGIGLKYYRGLFTAQNTQVDGYLLTTPYVINSQVLVGYRWATGGNGIGFDLGATYTPQTMFHAPHSPQPTPRSPWTFALAILDLNFGINWTQGLQAGVASVSLDSFSVARMNDNTLQSEFLQTPAPAFQTRLPVYVVLGASYRPQLRNSATPQLRNFLSAFTLGASVSEATANTAFSSTIPRGTLSAEYRGLRWLPLSVDASIGGNPWGTPATPEYGLGLGLNLKGLTLRSRLANSGGLALASKGVSFGLSATYRTGVPAFSEPDRSVLELHSKPLGRNRS